MGTNHYKIGFTTRAPSIRLKELQTGSCQVLELVHVWHATIQEEHELHAALAGFRGSGEWFDISIGKLLEAISTARTSLLNSSKELSPRESLPNACDLVIGEYGQVRVKEGVHKGLEGFYSEDRELSLYNMDPDIIPYLCSNDKVEDQSYLVAHVYLTGIGEVDLPFALLEPSD